MDNTADADRPTELPASRAENAGPPSLVELAQAAELERDRAEWERHRTEIVRSRADTVRGAALVLVLLAIVISPFWAMAFDVEPNDFGSYIAPVTGIAGTVVGYWFGQRVR